MSEVLSSLKLKSDEEQTVDIIRGLISSKRRWNITEENRKKAVDTVVDAMGDGDVKVRLKAAATLRLMEHDNQDDEWKAKQIEAEQTKPHQVLVQNNHITVDQSVIAAVLSRRKKPEVIENQSTTTPEVVQSPGVVSDAGK